jgi:polyhydroxybutyrate depolymerase
LLCLLEACAADPLGAHAGTASKAREGGVAEGTRAPGDSCQLDPKPPSGHLTITSSGVARELELVLPSGYDGRKRFPVLFAWHGTSSSGSEFIDSLYGAITDGVAGRALIVAPDGLIETEGEWAGMTRWQLSNVDGALFDLLLDKLNREYCIDEARVFSTGHSIGAYFTNYLGCTRGDRLRAIAPIAGGGPLDTSECVGHPAVLIGHNPAECATASPPQCPFAVPWADTGWPSTKFWAAHNACDEPDPMPVAAYDGNPPCRALTGCDPGSPVTLCLYDYETNYAGPHAWPTPWMARLITDTFLHLPVE